MGYIPLDQCKHGYGYKIRSRNLSYGVFNAKKNGFIGIRLKFGERYLFAEYHWDTGAPHGTVKPIAIDEKCPVALINESLGIFSEPDNRQMEFRKEGESGAKGWYYLDNGEQADEDVKRVWRENKELFEWLDRKTE
jgi:hypothetical protein